MRFVFFALLKVQPEIDLSFSGSPTQERDSRNLLVARLFIQLAVPGPEKNPGFHGQVIESNKAPD